MKRIRSKLTYANVISTLALFFVLTGGAAIAANQLGKNTVGAKQIKAASIGTGKLKAGAVKGGKLADGAVTTGKIADGAVTTPKLADSAVTGAKLVNGSVVASKLGPIVTRVKEGAIENNEQGTILVSCNPGETLLGGGGDWVRKGPDLELYLAESAALNATTWRVTGINIDNGGNITLKAYAYCLAA